MRVRVPSGDPAAATDRVSGRPWNRRPEFSARSFAVPFREANRRQTRSISKVRTF